MADLLFVTFEMMRTMDALYTRISQMAYLVCAIIKTIFVAFAQNKLKWNEEDEDRQKMISWYRSPNDVAHILKMPIN